MTVRLPCPICRRPLWVRIGTAGGHHTEAWPAHECVAPVPSPVRASGRPCMDCDEPMESTHGHTKRCNRCRHLERQRIDAEYMRRRQARSVCA